MYGCDKIGEISPNSPNLPRLSIVVLFCQICHFFHRIHFRTQVKLLYNLYGGGLSLETVSYHFGSLISSKPKRKDLSRSYVTNQSDAYYVSINLNPRMTLDAGWLSLRLSNYRSARMINNNHIHSWSS